MNAPFRPEAVERVRRALKRQWWDRGDGWDDRNPRAPDCYRCWGCDLAREAEVQFCPDCAEITSGYLWKGPTQ
jgi:hypothetical protein